MKSLGRSGKIKSQPFPGILPGFSVVQKMSDLAEAVTSEARKEGDSRPPLTLVESDS